MPGAYFGHYEQFFRQRLTDNHEGHEGVDNVTATPGDDHNQDIYRRWMSDTDISSVCIDNASTRYTYYTRRHNKVVNSKTEAFSLTVNISANSSSI